jgi:hypothetical protein
MSDAEITHPGAQWVRTRLDLPATVDPSTLGFIDMGRFARYDPAAGFQISVDGAHRLNDCKAPNAGKELTFALCSLSPPAGFYQVSARAHTRARSHVLASTANSRTLAQNMHAFGRPSS